MDYKFAINSHVSDLNQGNLYTLKTKLKKPLVRIL